MHDMPFVLKLCLAVLLTSAQSLLSVPFVTFIEMTIKSNSLRCAVYTLMLLLFHENFGNFTIWHARENFQ